jgi:hypothetical protein
MPTREDVNEWSAADLFDLHQYLQRGYGIEDTARFLRRDAEAVGLKAKELDRASKLGRAR